MELTPLQVDTTRLHQLANAIMCQDEEDLQRTLSWPGPDQGSRQQLLNSLQVNISTAVTRQLAAADTHATCMCAVAQYMLPALVLLTYGQSKCSHSHTFSSSSKQVAAIRTML